MFGTYLFLPKRINCPKLICGDNDNLNSLFYSRDMRRGHLGGYWLQNAHWMCLQTRAQQMIKTLISIFFQFI